MRTASEDVPLTLPQLQDLLRTVEPAAVLVPPRLLRRIIKQVCAIKGIGLLVPHRKTLPLARATLLRIVEREELGLPTGTELPEAVLLLTSPEPRRLAQRPRAVTLVKYWRLLFHACVDQHFARLRDEGKLPEPRVHELIDRIGFAQFAEIRQVLHQERFLLPPEDDATVLCEFFSLYLELRSFAHTLLPRYFPAVDNWEGLDQLAAEFLDADRLYQRTRLEGAPDPETVYVPLEEDGDEDLPPEEPEPTLNPSPVRYARLLDSAKEAGERGNSVRAAIQFERARKAACTPEGQQTAHDAARQEIDRLTSRLAVALQLHHHEAEEWRHRLPILLEPATRGPWPAAARLLYDLQKVCVYHERDLYAADLVEWIVTFGKRPIKRLLPHQCEVLLVQHLRSALNRLGKVRMDDEQRRKLSILMHASLHHCEERLRDRFRPILHGALDEVGLQPGNYPERIARRKLVEELLDLIIERGFLTIGDLRDAISRNQLKLYDLSGPGELLKGDILIRLNRRLAEDLDGVYRRGEIYLRWLQRGSSLAFGTRVGRWLTRYLFLPYGAAFGALVCAKEIYHICHATVHWVSGLMEKMFAQTPEELTEVVEPVVKHSASKGEAFSTFDLTVIAVLGTFFLLLICSAGFRARVWRETVRLWNALVFVVTRGPEWVMDHPAIKKVLENPLVHFFRHYLLRAALLTLVVAWLCSLTHLLLSRQLMLCGVTFALGAGLFNSRGWRLLEEVSVDWLSRNGHWLWTTLLPGLVRWILYLFKAALDHLERWMYTVDEWLRFRSGQAQHTFTIKTVLGFVWFLLTYLIRVVINLFVEPTFNPIKHFPVVTMAAKLIIPYIPNWAIAITHALAPFVGDWLAGTMAGVIILLIPGIAGFVAWELKENWRLYRANRANELGPVMIGHHGENMLRFFSPGLHSGTVPKIFIKLRRAARQSDGRSFHKQRENLLHVEESLRHFVERELLFLLEGSKGWGTVRLHLGTLTLGTNRVELELCHPDPRTESLWLAFEEYHGWLLARLVRRGWLGRLNEAQQAALTNALAGFYKLAGVDLVQEQFQATLPLDASVYTVTEKALLTWPGGDFRQLVAYPLEEKPPAEGSAPRGCPLFSHQSILWDAWVETWELDQAGKLPVPRLLPSTPLLPAAPG